MMLLVQVFVVEQCVSNCIEMQELSVSYQPQ
jgi:hypothetical protein